MAVWGQGDPRWLVEHREDGKNVNNWHWSEVNRLEWSRKRLAELLPGVGAPPLEGTAVRVTRVKSVTGEAMLTTRKGNKRFAYYDLKLTIAWEAAPVAEAPSSAQAAGEAAEAGGGGGQAAGGDVGAGQEAGAGSAGKPSVTGEISLAEFGSGSDHDDLEVTVTATGGEDGERERLRRHAQAELWPLVLQRLEQFVRELGEA